MAKKRSASTTTSGAQSGPAAKKPPGPKQSKSSTRSKPVTPDAPMIDTSAAARAAAAMLLHRDKLVRQRQQKGSLVEQIKSELSRPHAATVTNILNQSGARWVAQAQRTAVRAEAGWTQSDLRR